MDRVLESLRSSALHRVSGRSAAHVVLGVPIQIGIGFVAVSVLVGSRNGPAGSLATLGALLSMVLVHELPRALVARAAGRSAQVELRWWGPHTVVEGPPLHGLPLVAFGLAGSLANGLIAFACLAVLPSAGAAQTVLLRLALCHGAWATAHLLPAPPFHAAALVAAAPPKRRALLACASTGIASSATVLAVLLLRSPLLGIAFTCSAVASTLAIGPAAAEVHDLRHGITDRLVAAEQSVFLGHLERASELATEVLRAGLAGAHHHRAWRVVAWTAIGNHDAPHAFAAIAQLPREIVDVHLLAAYLNCAGDDQALIDLLELARGRGHRSTETTKLLLDALVHVNSVGRALEIAIEDAALLTREDAQRLVDAVSPPRDCSDV